MPLELSGITVGELIKALQKYDPDFEIYMGGLHFYRLKQCAEDIVHLEFNEVVYRDMQAGELQFQDTHKEVQKPK